jgi:hypothetical protein
MYIDQSKINVYSLIKDNNARMAITLSWLRANQSLLFLFNDMCLVEKQQILIS